jgi:hypothetical protein
MTDQKATSLIDADHIVADHIVEKHSSMRHLTVRLFRADLVTGRATTFGPSRTI